MTVSSPKARPAWMDRFRAPSIDELLEPFNKQLGGVVEHFRQRLQAIDGVREEVSWQGVWRWTLVYFSPVDPNRIWVYLVPDPAKPRIAVPVPDSLIPQLPVKKLSKFIRDGLAHSPIVDGMRWAHWEVQAKTQADDLVALANLRLSLPAKPAAQVAQTTRA